EPVPAASFEGVTVDLRGPIERSAELGPQTGTAPSGPALDRPKAQARSGDASQPRGERGPSAFGEATPGASRPIDRGPRRRKLPRARVGGARRNDVPRRSRPEGESPEPSGDHEASPAASISEVELPTVRDILANHRNSHGPRTAVERPLPGRQAIPTVPQ